MFTQAFSIETNKLVTNVLKSIFEAEATSEVLKNRLIDKLFDPNKGGIIFRDELKRILEDYGIIATNRDVQHIMDRYDKTQDGLITSRSFNSEINPKSPSMRRNN